MYLSYRNNTFIIIKMKHLLLLFLMLLFKTDIICGQIVFPTPEQINISEGYFEWKEKSVSVYASDKVKKNILLFSNYFVGQKTLKWCKNRVKAEIRFIEDSICPSEGYRLHITPKFIEISASDKGGFIYAILDMKLRDNHDLQLWFSSEMAKYLEQKGRKAIFWGDVVYKEGYLLPDNVIIQWWNFRGHKDLALKNAVRRGHPVVCSTNNYTYLNFPLTPWRGYKEDRTFDLKDVYLNNPSYIASKEDEPLILGIGCALWTDDGVREYMIDQRLFPRILALSEQMWHKGNLVDFQDFYDRILQKKDWFQTLGYHFGPALKGEVNTEYKWD